jgi:hypothetical protein
LLREVDVIVCPSSAAAHVGSLAGSTVELIIDDRTLDPRAVEMLAAVLVRHNGVQAPAASAVPSGRRIRPFTNGSRRRRRTTRPTARGK